MPSKLLDQIIEAGIVEFARKGYNATTTKDIAERAGVTEGSIYRLFKTKDELFERCIGKVIARSLSADEFARSLVGLTLREKLQNALAVQWARSEPNDYLVGLAAIVEKPELAKGTIRRELRLIYRLIESLLVDELERGMLREEVVPEIAAEAIYGSLFRRRVVRAYGEQAPSIDFISRHLDMWMFGILSPTAPNRDRRHRKVIRGKKRKTR
jgi:AcrR family transcriptional regulator